MPATEPDELSPGERDAEDITDDVEDIGDQSDLDGDGIPTTSTSVILTTSSTPPQTSPTTTPSSSPRTTRRTRNEHP